MEAIFLGKYSQKGYAGFVQSPDDDRKSAIQSLLSNAGGNLIDIQFVRGHYDVLVRAEVDNFETLGAIKILVAASGAFDAIETLEIVNMKDITDKVGKLSGAYRAPGN